MPGDVLEGFDGLGLHVSRETTETLETYVQGLLRENDHQNLISRTTAGSVWTRHILDCAQLFPLARQAEHWLDIGSGPGLPGMVLAILSSAQVTLVEPRARRVDFLTRSISQLKLRNVTVEPVPLEKVAPRPFDAITARAVATLPSLFTMAARFATASTTWVLPKGRSANQELAQATREWQGDFRSVPSITDPESAIVVARDVRRREA